MNALLRLASAWQLEPTIIAGCAALLFARIATFSPAHAHSHPAALPLFTTGIFLLLFALVSPLDILADSYLFSAHMLQHLLLVLVVPPLFLLGAPHSALKRLLAMPFFDRAEELLSQPILAWLIGVGVVWLWHAPALYDAALTSERMHVIEHLTFLIGATIYWWLVVAPLPERRRVPSWGVLLYLLLGALANSILGIVLTFAPVGLFSAYVHPIDTLGLLPFLRGDLGLNAAVDQELGGLLMWIGSGFVYLTAIAATFVRWNAEPETDGLPYLPWPVEVAE